MKELLFQSNVGIQFVKEVHRDYCSVKVQTRRAKRAYTLKNYYYPKIESSTTFPLLSWENLNCCGGWPFDESYLLTAVQEGKKPYAGNHIYLKAPEETSEAKARLEKIRSCLPDNCTAGEEVVINDRVFPFYICRRGCLKDLFDLEQVLEEYKKMGLELPGQEQKSLFSLGEIELAEFASAAPMCYYDTRTDAEYIATGLLLGYPLESTASNMMGIKP